MISCEVLAGEEKLKDYQGTWERLFAAGSYEASLSFEWTKALLDTHLGDDRFSLIVVRDAGEVLGLVPICLRQVIKHGLSVSTIMPVAEYFNTHSDLLVCERSEEVMVVLWEAIFAITRKWDIFRINRLVAGNPLVAQLTGSLHHNFSFVHHRNQAEPSFYLALGASYPEYLRSKSAKFRYNLKNSVKKMAAAGEVGFLREYDFDEFETAYRLILAIEEKSWKHAQGTAITSTAKQRQFYRELCGGAFRNGWLRFSILTLNAVPIAFEMGLEKEKKYYSVHGSYDESYRRQKPGTVLLATIFEELIGDGVWEFDWFGEPFAWEREWTDTYRGHQGLIVYNRTVKASLLQVHNLLKKIVRPREKAGVVLRNPRA